ncbi:MAG: CBS domain-containing protein [Myxococcales bacterium]
MRIDQIMSVPVETILPGASLSEAKAAMQRAGIRHLVVLGRSHRVAGVLSACDLRGVDRGSTVEDLMSAPAITLPAGADLKDAAKLLRRRSIGCLPLLERGRVVGIVTTSDLLALLGKGALRIQPRTRKWTMPKRGPTHRPQPRRA